MRMNQRFFQDFQPNPLEEMKSGPLLKTVLEGPSLGRSNAANEADILAHRKLYHALTVKEERENDTTSGSEDTASVSHGLNLIGIRSGSSAAGRERSERREKWREERELGFWNGGENGVDD